MNNDELKKKIVETIMRKVKAISFARAEQIADALIAAGIGDVKTVREIGASAAAMAVFEAAKAERRAEVAEMALKDCIDYYSYSGLCPVLDCNYNKACWRKECTPDIEKCFMVQAEKELAEEGKDEER